MLLNIQRGLLFLDPKQIFEKPFIRAMQRWMGVQEVGEKIVFWKLLKSYLRF